MFVPEKMRVFVPPEIPQDGITLNSQTLPKATVYSFAFYIWQSLNHWESGALDYHNNLLKYRAFLTPHFMHFLQSDYNLRMNEGELQDRTSMLQGLTSEGFKQSDVTYIGHNTWEVTLTFRLTETMNMNQQTVKDADMKYVLRVVRYAVDASQNPWGLALAGFVMSPSRVNTRI